VLFSRALAVRRNDNLASPVLYPALVTY